MNPIKAALLRRDRDRLRCHPGLAQSNGSPLWAKPFLQPDSEAPAATVRVAWEPVRAGQSVPMLGEEVGYVEPCYDD
jgi:hypothetical protein